MPSVRALLHKAIALIPVAAVVGALACSGGVELPVAVGERALGGDEALIEERSVCVASTVRSAGKLGDTLFYRSSKRPDGRLEVGYYVFFSEERPWGNNWLTWAVVPALAIDLFYTRSFLVAPGLQRAAYGKGDVEGFRVIYGPSTDGRLTAERAFADDASHRPTELGPRDLFGIDPDRPTLITSSWSHQLGARGKRAGDLVYKRCYDAGAIRPLTQEIARDFNLEKRARPAAVGDRVPSAPSVAQLDK